MINDIAKNFDFLNNSTYNYFDSSTKLFSDPYHLAKFLDTSKNCDIHESIAFYMKVLLNLKF